MSKSASYFDIPQMIFVSEYCILSSTCSIMYQLAMHQSLYMYAAVSCQTLTSLKLCSPEKAYPPAGGTGALGDAGLGMGVVAANTGKPFTSAGALVGTAVAEVPGAWAPPAVEPAGAALITCTPGAAAATVGVVADVPGASAGTGALMDAAGAEAITVAGSAVGVGSAVGGGVLARVGRGVAGAGVTSGTAETLTTISETGVVAGTGVAAGTGIADGPGVAVGPGVAAGVG